MAGQIGVIVIHGMGSQEPGYSVELKQAVSHELGDSAKRVKWNEIYWADILEVREQKLMTAESQATEPDGSSVALDWRSVREFVVHNFGDALAYHRDTGPNTTYKTIQAKISAGIAKLAADLKDPKAPIVVMAHSLGAHMMSDYIWDRQHNVPGPFAPLDTLVAMITFGCNIPLFSLEFDVATPIDLPAAGVKVKALRDLSRWRNYLDRDDVLGWPMRTLYTPALDKLNAKQKDTVNRIEDYEINVGNLISEWNPAAHSAYWTDDDFVEPVAEYLQQILDAIA